MDEELLALQAIYCEPDEFIVHAKGNDTTNTIISVTISGNDSQVIVTFDIPPSYPNELPHISIACACITRSHTAAIIDKLMHEARELIGAPMIMDLIMTAKNLCQAVSPGAVYGTAEHVSVPVVDETHYTALLKLDHMRAKVKYVKTIVNWTEELNLVGRLIFIDRSIFILLQGAVSCIKEYILRQRTVCVDVDSKGRSCKERMLSVLHQSPTRSDIFAAFEVVELSNIDEVHDILLSVGLSNLFIEYIRPIKVNKT